MTDAEIITTFVALVAVLAAFGLGWVAGAAYATRLRRRLRRALAERGELAAQLAESETALSRATQGTDDLLAAVRAGGAR
ncbi:hypothetical protein [Nocardiopsis alba]|uniref:hypothetical protein n=1 Tax=Nocardiopsis alba TaxID=53437 RepID=UPI0035D79B5A